MAKHSKVIAHKTIQYTPLSYQEIPELKKAYNILNKLANKYEMIKNQRRISEDEKYGMAKDILIILDVVGELTDPLFKNMSVIESKYFTLINDPVVAREMFLKEYEGSHKPYDYVKNFAWHLYHKVLGLKETE